MSIGDQESFTVIRFSIGASHSEVLKALAQLSGKEPEEKQG